MNTTTPIFSKTDSLKFFRTLNKRVNDYFKENKIDKTGNWKLHLKTIVMFSIFNTLFFPFSNGYAFLDLFTTKRCDRNRNGWRWYERYARRKSWCLF